MGCSRVTALLGHVFELVQIKHRGQYTDPRLLALHKYAECTPAWRVVLVLLLTPMPSLAIIAGIEIVPLADPHEGPQANGMFYVRMFITYLIMACTLQQQFCVQVGPTLPISTRTLVFGTLVVAISTMSAAYLLALAIGFPVPFTMPITGPSYLLAEVLVLGISWWPYVKADRSVVYDIARGCLYFILQWSMIAIYPVHYYGFTNIPDSDQLARMAFFGLLPLIKLTNRRLFDIVSRKTNDGDQLTPIVAVLNADVLGSLFVAFSIQFKPTVVMSALVAAAKFLQAAFFLREFRADTLQLQEIANRIFSKSKLTCSPTSSRNLVERAVNILINQNTSKGYGESTPHTPMKNHPQHLSHSGQIRSTQQKKTLLNFIYKCLSSRNRVAVASNLCKNTTGSAIPLVQAKAVDTTTQEQLEHTFLTMVRKLLYTAEVILLIDYIEVIIPLLYCLYLVIIYNVPNRVFYSQFAGMDESQLRQTISSVLLYTTFDMISLAITHTTLRRLFGISPFYQLSFVLSQQFVHVQSTLVLWTTHSTQASLDHFGNDYSFRFEWLRDKST